ncbi:MAG: SDR family NAD(P)-dependent oxidoreductase [Chloroflexi bacterium AL-W]|nr:SDR family NAD(P)-dependent oxidoreductase [Chloroflexi bacterium AL-N1]NOK65610.1 SDR family NAD(P)-dependent oxidoreductase [Chloroflexi bacterium AL-N10]NOK74449.1 SDR family NAD(P)-dependent oxidoreductase [Chloroflexi bacterium AL-N5]NOK80643.1 SDR family NAD(P)-dependent oxidoreductase [Chloroflexi bacterium AL-W]NOK88707.1 SDR family NAD(P)-dependent oxidoreductase [Chloroflexi bacterium AL-N15]
MNKKLLGSIAMILAGVGVYTYVRAQRNNHHSLVGETATSGHWTTEYMPDLTGKIIVVTGANSGIGFEAAKEFARKGAQTILACRNMDKAQAAFAQIQTEIPHASAEIMRLDLASLSSVHQFAAAFKTKYNRLNVLVNNAGLGGIPYSTTDDGFETQFGVNHLGHFALTGLLIDLLLKTPDARVVNVSSGGHRFGNMDFDNLMYEGGKGYSVMGAYGRSKLANLLFTYELQCRLEAVGANCIAVAAHPGASSTNLGSHLEKDGWHMRLLLSTMGALAQSAAMGALPTLRAAVDSDVRGGDYYGSGGLMEARGYPVKVQSNAASHNTTDQRRLWDISQELVKVRYL